MSLNGKADSVIKLRGSLSLPEAIQGKSAYEIAVAHGFRGTEAEWLADLKTEGTGTVVSENGVNQAYWNADKKWNKDEGEKALADGLATKMDKMAVDTNATANTLVKRTSDGRVKAALPTENDDAVNLGHLAGRLTQTLSTAANDASTKDTTVLNNAKTYADGKAAEKANAALADAKAYTDHELATFDFIKVVSELPETGLPNKFYLVPNGNADGDAEQTQNLFDEYIWVEKEGVGYWEWVTTKQLEVDLTPYVKAEEGKGLSTNDLTDYLNEWLTAERNKSANKWPHGDVTFSVTVADGIAARKRFFVPVEAGKTYIFSWDFESTNSKVTSGWARIVNACASDQSEAFAECASGRYTFTAPGDFVYVELHASYEEAIDNLVTYSNIMLNETDADNPVCLPWQPYGGGNLVRGDKLKRFKSVWYSTRDASMDAADFAKQVLLLESIGGNAEWIAATLDMNGVIWMMWGFAARDGNHGKMFLVSYNNPLRIFNLDYGNWAEEKVATYTGTTTNENGVKYLTGLNVGYANVSRQAHYASSAYSAETATTADSAKALSGDGWHTVGVGGTSVYISDPGVYVVVFLSHGYRNTSIIATHGSYARGSNVYPGVWTQYENNTLSIAGDIESGDYIERYRKIAE